MDILYGAWFYKKSSTSMFVDGDFFLITPTIPVTERDTFILNPKKPIIQPPVAYSLELLPSYPNPFGGGAMIPSSGARIPFSLARDGHVALTVYSTLGRTVWTIVDGILAAGKHEYLFLPGSYLASGIYTVELVAGDERRARRMVYLR